MLKPFPVAALSMAAGVLIGLAGTAGAAPQSTVGTTLPSYCTSPVQVVRHYSIAVDAGDNALRSGVAGHGGKLDCITLDAGNYQKTIEFNPGWLIPAGGLNVTYFNCLLPGFRWSPTGKPFNDCEQEYAKSVTTPDGGLRITWPLYNGAPMVPATTP